MGKKVDHVRRMTAPLRCIGDELTLFGANPFSTGIYGEQSQTMKTKIQIQRLFLLTFELFLFCTLGFAPPDKNF